MKFTFSALGALLCIVGRAAASIGDGNVGASIVVTAYPFGMQNDEFVCEHRWKVRILKEQAKFASKFIPTIDGTAVSGAPSGWPKEFNASDRDILRGCSGTVYQWPLNYSTDGVVGSDFLFIEADYANDKAVLCNAVTTGANGDFAECGRYRNVY